MNLLFIIDPPDSLKAYKDTTVAMMRAAEARGHAVHVCEQGNLAWHAGSVGAEAMRIRLTDNDEDWYRRDGHAQRSLAWFDAVLMRKDPPFDLEYVTSTWLLSAAVREGARVFNAPDAMRDHNEKLAIAEFPALRRAHAGGARAAAAARLHRRAARRGPEAPGRDGRREHLPRARAMTPTAT